MGAVADALQALKEQTSEDGKHNQKAMLDGIWDATRRGNIGFWLCHVMDVEAQGQQSLFYKHNVDEEAMRYRCNLTQRKINMWAARDDDLGLHAEASRERRPERAHPATRGMAELEPAMR